MSNAGFNKFRGSDDYVTSEALRNAVNVAIALARPLLVRGEPGTGKTLLAHSIARDIGKKLIVWNIKPKRDYMFMIPYKGLTIVALETKMFQTLSST
jgi:MoxR-like ATPase